jgi:hypothetical protein
VIDNVVITREGKRRGEGQHLCLDKGYSSKQEEQELIKQGYVLHIPYKKIKKGQDNMFLNFLSF